ncbi:MAG: glycosyltransferase [Chitinivibrionales bacterium]|nr:glycosyltransferase [Chitinivibrionales bacterium]
MQMSTCCCNGILYIQKHFCTEARLRFLTTGIFTPAATLAFCTGSAIILIPGDAIVGHPAFLIGALVMFASMLVLWRWWPGNSLLLPLAVVAIGIRIAFVVFYPESDDLYRYIWEGNIQLHGYSPFTLPPDAAQLEHLRDEIWEGINHKHISTIYWPGAQLLFRLLARLSPSVLVFKGAFLLFDVGVILLLMVLARMMNFERRHLLLYLLNPLVIIFTAGEGHLEIVAVFGIVLGLVLQRRQQFAAMFAALGMAVMVKLVPIVVLPFVITRKSLTRMWALTLPMLLIIPFIKSGLPLLDTPVLFASKFRHNGLIYTLLSEMLSARATLIVEIIALIALLGIVFFLTPHPIRATYQALGLFILFSPTMHPWYLQLLTPFVVLFRNPAWLLLHATVLPLTFYFDAGATGDFWRNRELLLRIEYLPFVLTGIWWVFQRHRNFPAQFAPVETISVVIPALNEEMYIADCLQSIVDQNEKTQIILADAHSTDGTLDVAKSYSNVEILTTDAGRGIQILEGLRRCTGELIVILHADSRLKKGVLKRLKSIINRKKDLVGGAMAAKFDNQARKYRFIELLNNIRARLTGISFGDQAQFLRKSLANDNVQPLKLMEDIELSYLLKSNGGLLFFKDGVTSSTRRWEKQAYTGNVFKVVWLTLAYLFLRRFDAIKKQGQWFYEVYYEQK